MVRLGALTAVSLVLAACGPSRPPASSRLFGRPPAEIVAALNTTWAKDVGSGALTLEDDPGAIRACDGGHLVCLNIDAPTRRTSSVVLVARHRPEVGLSRYAGGLLTHLLQLASPGADGRQREVLDKAVAVGAGGDPGKVQLPQACAGASEGAGAVAVRLDPGGCSDR